MGLPWGSEEGQKVSNTSVLNSFPGLCSIPTSRKVQDGEVGKGSAVLLVWGCSQNQWPLQLSSLGALGGAL